ncbi:MAG TPA: carboxylating nicotinate-nucleotide diphosphorylase [Pirellulaceae bacterium]|nr:carboxylating nicotinate-nucleotide diphosphorylase [Pirellulaceae bacterium]HMO91577.1 carboxylating nicotinate-nucleotide diphosphorylase [Pirellulaceae bacterium]HMP68274.1 carboxylating nicotinate-nucleotide diphosphorylase [Pirellulaceae bacterium]
MTNWNEAVERECHILVELALREDLGGRVDCTTSALVDPRVQGSAAFVARKNGVVCGVEVAKVVCRKYSDQLSIQTLVADGQRVKTDETIAVIKGSASAILVVERTCLNFLGRLSGIASLTSEFVTRVAGTNAKIFDTRKTTPAFRHLEKYAVRCGGGQNHRFGLFDAILIKDNHLAFAAASVTAEQSIEWAVSKAREWIADHQQELPMGLQTIVQIEVDDLQQLERALVLPIDIVLLDNMSVADIVQAVKLRNTIQPSIELEISGGVNLDSVRDFASTGVERISVGAITHSAINFDIGLDWEVQ